MQLEASVSVPSAQNQVIQRTITSDPENVTVTGPATPCAVRPPTSASTEALLAVGPVAAAPPYVMAVVLCHVPTLRGFVDQIPVLAIFHAASNDFCAGNDAVPRLTRVLYVYSLGMDDSPSTPRLSEEKTSSGGTVV
ncbi:hypothetical protein ABZP36_031873 [Zizania latifolia]